MKGKWCLTNLTAFYDEMTSMMDGRREANVAHLHFTKAFDTSSYNILIGKLMKYGLDKWSER